MKLAFEPIWPWWLIVVAMVAMLAVVRAGYPRRIRRLPIGWQRVLMGLRVALVLLLTIWLARPVVIYESDDSTDAVVYVMMDISGSMKTPDAFGGKTRREAMLELLERARPLLDDLGDSVEIRYRDFAEGMQPFAESTAEPDGAFTAIGANLETLAKESAAEKIAAVLLWSDGKQAASGRLDVDAVQAARLLGRRQRPLYTVPFGNAELLDKSLDLALSDLDVPRDVFIRNVVPVKVRFRASGAQGQEVRVRVLVEQRGGLLNGVTGQMLPVTPDQDNRTLITQTLEMPTEDQTLELQFVPQEAGEIKVAVEVESLEGELRTTNNRVETIIRVRSGGIRVVYFDDPRFEFRHLKRINISNRIQLDAQPVWRGRFASRNEFDESWFEPGNYDAFIIGDVPAEYFGPQRLAKIAQCCEQGAGLMMLGGQNNFALGGYGNSPLAKFLPVDLSGPGRQLEGDVPMVPRRVASSILQIAPPEQNARRWGELPPLKGANLLRLKPGSAAAVLAESRNGDPLLISQSFGAARSLAFAGDTTWQWALHADWAAEAHERFWRQAIFWLTKMELNGESPLWINVEPRSMAPGREAVVAFGLRDQDGLPIPGGAYELSVQNPNGESSPVATRGVDSRGEGSYQDTMIPGDYWATVSTDAGGELGTLYSSTRFLVDARDPELDNPAADPALLRELANASGGDFLTPDSMLERLTDWSENGLPSLEMVRSERVTLWDNWFSLLLFVLLACSEWALRKKRGLV
ncbi:MAG: glutamine amidotransferase [Planctomycetaceae bacterium]|nr:glutamine amidotransferase [Planctomycetaceae bacterium]